MRTLATLALCWAAIYSSAQSIGFSPTFGNNGTITQDMAPGDDHLKAHVLRPDGKLLLGGDGYNLPTNDFHAIFALIDPACGAFDTNFGTGGTMSHIFESRTQCTSIALQPDGKILGCGLIAPNNFGSEQWPGVFRFMPDGSVDTSFNHTGYHRLQFHHGIGNFSEVIVHADSTITCTGAGDSSGFNFYGAHRFRYDGSLDSTFGLNGRAVLLGPSIASAADGAGLLLPDGSVISIASSWPGSGNDRMITMTKFDSTGQPDVTFGSGGLAATSVAIDSQFGMGAVLQADGKFLVSGRVPSIGSNWMIARFLPDGTPDPSYGMNGVSMIPQSAAGGGHAGVQLLADGSSLQFGQYHNGSNWKAAVMKRDQAGQLVTAFGGTGLVVASTSDPAIQNFLGGYETDSGHIIGYGYSGEELMVIKLTPETVVDTLPAITLSGSTLEVSGQGPFTWYLNGTLIPGVTGNTFAPTQNGTYTANMTLSPDCIFTSDPFNVTTVGVEENQRNGIRVLQNPSSNTLILTNPGQLSEYSIIDQQGRLLMQGTINNGVNEIAVRSIAGGVHILRISDKAGSSAQRIVIY